MLQEGARGFAPRAAEFEPSADTLDEEDLPEYGIDWEAYHDNRIQQHHSINNPTDPFPQNPFIAHQPDTFSIVQVEESRCPFTAEELQVFHHNFSLITDTIRLSRDMEQRKRLWVLALAICRQVRQ